MDRRGRGRGLDKRAAMDLRVLCSLYEWMFYYLFIQSEVSQFCVRTDIGFLCVTNTKHCAKANLCVHGCGRL